MERRNQDIHRRARLLKDGIKGKGPVVYWMSRDQRINDNYALLRAQEEAIIHNKPLVVVFCLVRDYPGANRRHYKFLLHGLQEVQHGLELLNIKFLLLEGTPPEALPALFHKIDARILICDFDPLRIKRQWQQKLLERINQPIEEVDAHNVIPAWLLSQKREYAAYTIRPKVKRALDEYLTDIPELQSHPVSWHTSLKSPDILSFMENLPECAAADLEWLAAGESSAMKMAHHFVENGLARYSTDRNNPCLNGQSNLSPFLHFGQLAPQRLALMVSRSSCPTDAVDDFLEELIVRRELADNFCLYTTDYDQFSCFPDWARKTLNEHRNDPRAYCYSTEKLERAATHDSLWNACQRDLVQRGKLHGYLRMYWAKKILEWTASPEQAMEIAIRLNDYYSLDGRDPNGYAGIAWSIGGVHDRAWPERPVFGKVRYMALSGCKRKFTVQNYIDSIPADI